MYAVTAEGKLVTYDDADETCIGVALIVNDAPTPQRLMIEKNGEANTISGNAAYTEDGATYRFRGQYHWGPGDINVENIPDLVNDEYTNEEIKTDFNGKVYTAALLEIEDNDGVENTYANIATYCKIFNNTEEENQGYNDWYIPSAGQFGEIYNNFTAINEVLQKIGGTIFSYNLGNYIGWWTSNETNNSYAVIYNQYDGFVNSINKKSGHKVRFVRDL